MRTILPCLALVAAFASTAAAASGNIQGMWLTDDHKAMVRIAPCGGQLCGTIARVLDTGPGVPSHDINNPDVALRARPIVGMPILTGFDAAGASGHIYDPTSGRSYRSSLALNADGTLNVTGCVLVICQSRRWTRVR